MSAPLLPAPIPELVHRPFAFSPAISGIEHNEWLLRRSGWHEIVAVNAKTSQEISLPRKFLAGITEDEPHLPIAALTEALEFRRGRVVPVRRGILTMPRKREATPAWKRAGRPAPVVAIRVEHPRESRVLRALKGSVALGFVACLAVVFLVRDAHLARAMGWASPATRPLSLVAGDDYFAVVNKLGRPASDRWIETGDSGGIRRLGYPRRRLSVVLQGETRDTAVYLRSFGRDGRVVHSAQPSVLDDLVPAPVWR